MLTLAQGKDRLLTVCAKLTSARKDLEVLQYQLGFKEGRRDLLGIFVIELDQEITFLLAMYNDVELNPDAKGESKE